VFFHNGSHHRLPPICHLKKILESRLDLKNGFRTSGWKTNNGWQAEAVFLLRALGCTKEFSFDLIEINILSDKKLFEEFKEQIQVFLLMTARLLNTA